MALLQRECRQLKACNEFDDFAGTGGTWQLVCRFVFSLAEMKGFFVFWVLYKAVGLAEKGCMSFGLQHIWIKI